MVALLNVEFGNSIYALYNIMRHLGKTQIKNFCFFVIEWIFWKYGDHQCAFAYVVKDVGF